MGQQPTEKNTSISEQAFVDRIKKSDRWIIGLTLALVVSAIISAYIFKGQLNVMEGQLKEMQGAGMQTNKLIEEAAKQSKAARDSADASTLIVENAKKSIEIMQSNIRLEQRAWVGPVEAIMPKAGEKPEPHLGVKIMNSGKTPARRLLTKISTQYLPAEAEFAPSYKDDSVKPGVSVIQPGMRINLFSLATLGVMTPQEIDGVRTGRNILYLYGLITYEDIFGRPHSTRFCLYLQSDLSGFSACSTYNDAD